MSWPDVVGVVGVLMVILAYVALQAERIDPKTPAYSAANAVGALLIIVSLCFDFNLSAFVIEAFWLAISLYGLARAFRKLRVSAGNPHGG